MGRSVVVQLTVTVTDSGARCSVSLWGAEGWAHIGPIQLQHWLQQIMATVEAAHKVWCQAVNAR